MSCNLKHRTRCRSRNVRWAPPTNRSLAVSGTWWAVPTLPTCIAALALVFTTGCFGPLKNPASRKAVQKKAARERAEAQSSDPPTSTARINVAGNGPLAELIVKGETIKADQVWSRNRKGTRFSSVERFR